MGNVGTRMQTFGLKTLMEDWVLKKRVGGCGLDTSG